ncbi:MAG: GNAT family N-acetyltransferase [Ramlibacter sp.]
MKRNAQDIALRHNQGQQRYELEVGGALAAFADYRPGGEHLEFVHTEVLPGHEGQGLGSKLARLVLDDTRRQGLKVVPTCSFIARFIQGHAEYQDLVVGQNRG